MENSTRHSDFTGRLRQESTLMTGIFGSLAALNIFLSITESLGNVLILTALGKVRVFCSSTNKTDVSMLGSH